MVLLVIKVVFRLLILALAGYGGYSLYNDFKDLIFPKEDK